MNYPIKNALERLRLRNVLFFTVRKVLNNAVMKKCLQLKDAGQDLSREFVQAGLEWRLSHPDEARTEV